jgi:hypothetical protein
MSDDQAGGTVATPDGAAKGPTAASAAPCAAPATWIVFRGRAARRWLCDAHRATYVGSGRVARYAGRSHFDPPTDPAPGVFTGEPRRCGEETS